MLGINYVLKPKGYISDLSYDLLNLVPLRNEHSKLS